LCQSPNNWSNASLNAGLELATLDAWTFAFLRRLDKM